MDKWEYKKYNTDLDAMNKLGDEGWELVAAYGEESNRCSATGIYKRKKMVDTDIKAPQREEPFRTLPR
jgi:hypothetical protein